MVSIEPRLGSGRVARLRTSQDYHRASYGLSTMKMTARRLVDA